MKTKDIGTFIAGAAIGAGLTWLFTTDDGKELLAKVKDKAGDWKNELSDYMEKAKQVINDLEDEAATDV